MPSHILDFIHQPSSLSGHHRCRETWPRVPGDTATLAEVRRVLGSPASQLLRALPHVPDGVLEMPCQRVQPMQLVHAN